VLLFLTLVKTGDKTKAEEIIREFLNRISEPDRNIPSLSVLNELKADLRSFHAGKELNKYFSDIFSLLDDYQNLTQKCRRKIRKEASVVPFAPARIEIKAFGKAEVKAGNRTLTLSDWKTQTSRDLFFLFLAHPEGMTKEEVGLIFWPDSSPAELKLRFKNAIYRMRHAIGSDAVLFQDNFYQFNRSLDYEYDVQNFIAASTRAGDEKNTAKKKSALQTVIQIYRGAYLPDVNETWVVADRQKYLEMYLKSIEELVRIALAEKDFSKALDYCQQGLKEDICNEEIYRLTMEIHAALGNKAAISKQYETCRKVLRSELNTKPSPQTTSLYEKLIA
jgi:two-component SAPR family response regulator